MESGLSNAVPPQRAEAEDDAVALIHFLMKEVEWIRMLSGRLCRRKPGPERLEQDLASIRELSSSVARRMRSYLDDARCGGDSDDLTEIDSLVDEAVRRAGRRGSAGAISVRIDEEARGLLVPGQLLVAAVAVLENAIDFTCPTGRVAVRVQSEGRDLVVCVTDSGRGMSRAVLSACRARGFTTRPGAGGQGFGLYCASRILARNRGNLVLESTPGAGTQVRLTIPVQSRSGAPEPTSASPPRATGPGRRPRPRGSRC